MKLTNGVLVASLALSISACCGKKEPSRWDPNNKDKPPSATATAKPTNTPATPTAKPTAPPPSGGNDDKARCKKFDSGSVNKAFPGESEGYKRIYKADKEGYAEAEYTKGKEKLTLTIVHAPEKKGEYASLSDKVSGFPYKTFGKNKSMLLAKDCYLVSAFASPGAPSVEEPARKTWLGKFNFSALP